MFTRLTRIFLCRNKLFVYIVQRLNIVNKQGMSTRLNVCTMGFVFINIFSIVVYTVLGDLLSKQEELDKIKMVCSECITNYIYIHLVVFVGIRVYAMFIGNNLTDYSLHRILDPGGMRTKIRVMAVLVIIESVLICGFNIYVLYCDINDSIQISKNVLVLFCTAMLLNMTNLYLMNQLHPDLTGKKFKSMTNNYLDEVEQNMQDMV